MNPCCKEEIKKVKENIGLLRQWINEKPKDKRVTDKDIEIFLFFEEKEE